MRPSERQQKPRQTPRRKFDTDKSDRLACELALDMLNYITTRYANAADDEKPGLIIQYGPVVFELQKVISKAARARRRRNSSAIETK